MNTQLHGACAFAYNEKTDTLFAVAHAISRSTDGGNTREQVFDLKPYHGGEANIMSITCFEDYVVCTGADMLILISKDNGTTWSQLSQCPSKGGFLGLLQTEERIFGIGTFAKDSALICFLEKATVVEAVIIPPILTPTPIHTPTSTPTLKLLPMSIPPIESIPPAIFAANLDNELDLISNSLGRIVNYLRRLEI